LTHPWSFTRPSRSGPAVGDPALAHSHPIMSSTHPSDRPWHIVTRLMTPYLA